MTSASTLDAQEFRKALGSFATGVAIITTRAADGSAVGLTVNSFNSVSLNPPLVLWSLAETAQSLPVFQTAQRWAVHILATDQEALSARFAKRGLDKFSGLETDTGEGDVPLLKGCAARFQCRTAFQHQGGDHIIFIGEVTAFDRADNAPLVFHSGRYAHATRRDAPDAKPRDPYLSGSFKENFLGYLLGRSHFQFFGRLRPLLAEASLTDEQFYLLATLTLKQVMSQTEIAVGMASMLSGQGEAALSSLMQRNLISATGSDGRVSYQLTEQGSQCALKLITAAQDIEAEVLERMGAGESEALKTLLNRLLLAVDPAAPALWEPPVTDRKRG